jgi:hypothetical protein
MPQLTQLGWVFVPICLWYYNDGKKLLSIAVFGTVFGAGSVINLNFGGFGIGIIPPYFPGMVFITFSILRYLAGQTWGNEQSIARIYLPFILFTVYCILVTFIMPQIMAGSLLVWPQRNDIFRLRVPLYFGAGNISQLSYVIFNMIFCFLATCYVERKPWLAEHLLRAIFVSGYMVVFFGIWQFCSKMGGFYYPEDILYSNISGTINSDQEIGSVFRVSGSFNEPASLAGHVCGTVYATFWLMLAGDKRRLVLCLFVLSVILVLLSTSTTGYVVLCVGLPFMMVLSATSGKSDALLRLLKVGVFSATVIAVAVVAVPWVSPEIAARANDVIQATLEKQDSQSFDERTTWDLDAVSLLEPTLGFGAGWGSVRSSSLGPAILGGVGIWGFALFIWFIYNVAMAVRQARRLLADYPEQVRVLEALSASAVAILFGLALAGPNLNAMDAWLPLSAALGMVVRARRMDSTSQGRRPAPRFAPGAGPRGAEAFSRPPGLRDGSVINRKIP